MRKRKYTKFPLRFRFHRGQNFNEALPHQSLLPLGHWRNFWNLDDDHLEEETGKEQKIYFINVENDVPFLINLNTTPACMGAVGC